jgi:hypothetical protein
MFDLQPSIHLHEREAVDFRFVQEFDCAGVVIARCLTQSHRRLPQRLILLRRKRRRGCFFENFLVASLDGAVAHAGGPCCSVVVGNNLDLDVTRALHLLLHENGRIPEGLERLGPGASKGLRKLVQPNAPDESRDRPLRRWP